MLAVEVALHAWVVWQAAAKRVAGIRQTTLVTWDPSGSAPAVGTNLAGVDKEHGATRRVSQQRIQVLVEQLLRAVLIVRWQDPPLLVRSVVAPNLVMGLANHRWHTWGFGSQAVSQRGTPGVWNAGK